VAKIVIDVLFFGLFGVVATWLGAYWGFPSPRLYMCVGYALGLIIYSKSVKITLDFSKKVCYNTVNKISARLKAVRKKGREKA
jgi:hypothetical protein